jgi:hypothetical protein
MFSSASIGNALPKLSILLDLVRDTYRYMTAVVLRVPSAKEAPRALVKSGSHIIMVNMAYNSVNRHLEAKRSWLERPLSGFWILR